MKAGQGLFSRQSKKAMELFPDHSLHWFNKCGHFPHWDQPEQTIDLILRTTAETSSRLISSGKGIHGITKS